MSDFVPRSRTASPTIVAIGLAFSLACHALASDSQVDETTDFGIATRHIKRYVEKFGAEHVLFAVDIDNTLLAMDGPLGSDQWFEWQEYLLRQQPGSPMLAAEDHEGLLEAQGALFASGKMHPPQSDLPAIIAGIQATGVRTLVLTSRGPQFRSYTERELARSGYDFESTAVAVERSLRDPFKPYDLENIADSGLTAAEARLFHLDSPRDASYSNGVFMTSGQHKGAMLLTILAKVPRTIKAVVFIDDHGRNVARVYDALLRRGIAVSAVHYKREDLNVDRFKYSDKRLVVEQWRMLDDAEKFVLESCQE